MSRKVTIVGGGQAGFSFAEQVRKLGDNADITIFSAEPHVPYQRPPLSKRYAKREIEVSKLHLRPQSWYDKKRINLQIGQRITSIDAAARLLTTDQQDVVQFDICALATGSTARTLPANIGGELGNVLCLRDIADADQFSALLGRSSHVLIVGGGYIGLEAAAVASAYGLRVTLIEAAPRILQRVACEQTSAYFRKLHQQYGVQIIEGTGLEALTGVNGVVTGASLADGQQIDVDAVMVGIGIAPQIALAEAAGLTIDNGIKVNQFGETSAPGIYACGDCASFEFAAQTIRLESVQNATDQARNAAINAMAADVSARTAYQPVPWFWSEQYDTTMQIAGLSTGFTDVVQRDGSKPGAVSFWYFDNGQFIAVDVLNEPAVYMAARRLLEAGIALTAEQASDAGFDLKQHLQSQKKQ